jgi:hypothetical protein
MYATGSILHRRPGSGSFQEGEARSFTISPNNQWRCCCGVELLAITVGMGVLVANLSEMDSVMSCIVQSVGLELFLRESCCSV